MLERVHTTIAEPVRAGLRNWRDELRNVFRNPLVDPQWIRVPPAAVAFFLVSIVAAGGVLIANTSAAALTDHWVLLFAAAVLITDFAEIRFKDGRVITGNDIFLLVPFVWMPFEAAAMLVLLTTLVDPLLHPRPAIRLAARMSSTFVARLSPLATITIAAQLIPEGTHGRTLMLLAAGFAGIRLNDLVWFPISLRLGHGRAYSYRRHVASSMRFLLVLVAVEAPVAALATFAYPVSPWLVLALVIPNLAVARLTRLQPVVNQLQEADRLKSQILSVASHELRTPLTAIAGFAATLVDRWDSLSDEEKQTFLSIIHDQSGRLTRLVNDLLTISRVESGALQPRRDRVNLSNVIERTIDELGVAEKTTVSCDASLAALVDPDHLQQVLINYLTNAFKYGGEPVLVSARKAGKCVEIRVRDNGAGVPDEFVPYLFEMFSRAAPTEAEGTGLGLPIVKRLAEAQGGSAWYEPGRGAGSCFCVSLPAARGEAAAPAE